MTMTNDDRMNMICRLEDALYEIADAMREEGRELTAGGILHRAYASGAADYYLGELADNCVADVVHHCLGRRRQGAV